MTIIYGITISEESMQVRGNVCASDDAVQDGRAEDEVLRRLRRGDMWAWCCIEVSATCNGFVGRDFLGGCNYESKEDFKRCGYYGDMMDRARADLFDKMRGAVTRGAEAVALLALHGEKP